jgi:tRNA (guanosine-2'-O-)-methyltransferase
MVNLELLDFLESHLTEHRRERFQEVLSQRTRHFSVAVEDVYQLHNTSAVIRSCDVFGIQDVHIIEEVNVKKIDREIAMGAQKWVDVYRYQSAKECLRKLKASGYQIVATSPHAKDTDLDNFDVSQKSCFFFGRETEGLSEEVLAQADQTIKIPMVGFTESLNISVSAAIILQQLSYRLRHSTVNWRLRDSELQEKRLDWSKKTLKNHEALIRRFISES